MLAVEVQGPGSQHYTKIQERWHVSAILVPERQRTEHPWGSLASQPGYIDELQVLRGPFLEHKVTKKGD